MNKKCLTIAFVTNSYTPYEGGVVSSIKAYAYALRQCGHTVFIVTLDFTGAPNEHQVIPVFCPIHFDYKYGQIAVPWRAAKELEVIFLRLNPNIVHIHHPFVLGSAASDVCKKLGIPTIFTNHTQYDACLHYVPVPALILRSLVQHKLIKFCQQIDAIIAPSLFIKNRLISQGITRPISVLPSPILPIFSENMPLFIYKQSNHIKKLLYVGRFTDEKNIPLLLQLIKKLPSGRFSLTLAGYGYLEQQLTYYAYEKLKLSPDIVRFIKKPEKTVLCSLYKESDLFVFASKTEGNPVVFAEAMAAGTPIVSLRGNWHSEHLIDGTNGFWVNNLDHMCEQIETIERDEELFKKLQSGAWQTGRYFCSENLTQKLENIYYQVLAKR